MAENPSNIKKSFRLNFEIIFTNLTPGIEFIIFVFFQLGRAPARNFLDIEYLETGRYPTNFTKFDYRAPARKKN